MIRAVERIAVIDMGSNSWRLVVYGYEPGGAWSLIDELREPVRIGAGMGAEGTLKPEPIERGLHTASVFASFCRAAEIETILAVATSAIRDAGNRDELLDAIRDETGLEVRVLSGREEAWYGYLAIANSTTVSDGFGIDLGGGSVQIMSLEGRQLVRAESLPLGSVRMSEAFLPNEKAKAKETKAVRKHVRGELNDLGWWTGGGRLVGIGGTIRNLATAVQKKLEHPDLDIGGFILTVEALEELIAELAAKPASKRGTISGIKPDRGDVILGGALALAAAMREGGFEEIEVCEAGLREGIFFETFLDDRDPPLFEDVRRESVENLALRFDHDLPHARHVAKLSLEIYDGLGEVGLHEQGEDERDLLWAACRLHDIGTAIDYDDHHRHSHYLILNAGLPGYTQREQVLVGLIARYHRKGEPDPSELGDYARKGDDGLLRLLCGIVRVAEQLERSRDRSIVGVEVAKQNGAVELAATAGEGDTSVAMWAARRNADVLAEAIGREVEVV